MPRSRYSRLKPGVNESEISSGKSREDTAFNSAAAPVSVNAARLCKTLKAIVGEELGQT